ncbi:MAG: hypothetical protein ACREFB_11320, partial [Stellaceae bacterium]
MPPLRLAEAAAGAAVQRITHAREALEHDLARVVAARAEAQRRLTQITADLAREAGHLGDGDAALARLADERRSIEHSQGRDAAVYAEAASRLAEASVQLSRTESGLLQMTEACATGEARRAALERERRDLGERRSRLDARLANGERQRAALSDALVSAEALAQHAAAVVAAATEIEMCHQQASASGEAVRARQVEEAEAVDAAHAAERARARLAAEAEALTSLLAAAVGVDSTAPAILSQIEVPAGLEAAVAALCDSELSAPLLAGRSAADGATSGWIELAPLSEVPLLPAEATPLADRVGAPAALGRLLAHAGWVDSEETGWRLQPELRPGQSVVDRDGRLWRWDGFTRLSAGRSAT